MQPAPQLPKCTAAPGNAIDHTWDLRRLKASVNYLFPRQQRAQRSASAAADHKSSSDGVIYALTASRAKGPVWNSSLPHLDNKRVNEQSVPTYQHRRRRMAATHLRAAATHHRLKEASIHACPRVFLLSVF